MTKYWKMIAAVVGSLLTTGAAIGLLPPEYLQPENHQAILTAFGTLYGVVSAIMVWRFPANTG